MLFALSAASCTGPSRTHGGPVAGPRGGASASSAAPVTARAATHTVQAGETLWRISKQYHTTVAELCRLNGIADARQVRAGTRLRLPADESGSGSPGEASATATASRLGAGSAGSAGSAATAPGSIAGGRTEHPRSTARVRYPLQWPVDGRITSRFGQRNGRPHDGIDIVSSADTVVHAAGAGQVIFSARHGDYGNVVIVRHDDGLVTVYAHQSQNLVRKGDRVTAGQRLGKVGDTGRATAPHLHFEVRRGVTPQNPLHFLPP